MIIRIGNHELKVKEQPDIFIDDKKGIMAIIIVVEDKNGKMYELHYMSTIDDPDLIVNLSSNSFIEL